MLAGEKKTANSDIDLLFLARNLKEARDIKKSLLEVSEEFSQKFGKRLASYTQIVKEFRDKYKKKTGITKRIIEEGVLIYGKPISQLIE